MGQPFLPDDLSPVVLSYTAALSGVKPRATGEAFSYAQLLSSTEQGCHLMRLAASNPEGAFTGLNTDSSIANEVKKIAQKHHVGHFDLNGYTAGNVPPNFVARDYLVADLDFLKEARAAFLQDTGRMVKAGGSLVITYQAYENEDAILAFLVQAFGPEMSADQAMDFLDELLALNPAFFAARPDLLQKLNDAKAQKQPDAFLSLFQDGEDKISQTMEVMAALLPQGFALAGDVAASSHPLEITLSAPAQKILEGAQKHVLYEAIKDFALARTHRADLWCKLPVETSEKAPELFGSFTYGTTLAREQIPAAVTVQGETLDLSKAPYVQILDLMSTLPAGIGDFLSHPLGENLSPAEVLEAVQILIGLRLLKPMRGRYTGTDKTRMSQPQWATPFNAFLNDTVIASAQVTLASEVIGSPFDVSMRDALVLQAITRTNLSEAPQSLLPELKRLAETPALACHIMDMAEPTEELAAQIVLDTLNRSLVRWYAYGVLAA